VKIDNWESARPQSGLESTDIVYDTMAEGGITRYIAVFQCKSSASIGPVRSLRWVDPRVLRSLGKTVLAFAGGIQPNLDTVNSSPWLCVANAVQGPRAGAFTLNPDRAAPESTYTTTAALWKACPHWPPPPAQFTYSAAVPAGAKPAASARVPYTDYDAVEWVWSASHHAWLHYYDYAGLTPDYDAAGQQLQATNVVIQVTTAVIGPYPENSLAGSGDVESNTVGSGTLYVLRDGKVITGRWKRTSLASPTSLLTSSGQTIPLAPGNTWVEIVPANLTGSVSSPPVTITR
jgi:hypothetical protein